MSAPQILVKVDEAAALISQSPATIRRAIKTQDPNAFPPPLKAKRGGRGEYLIFVSELVAWANRLHDA